MQDKAPPAFSLNHPIIEEMRQNIEWQIEQSLPDEFDYVLFPQQVIDEFEDTLPPLMRYRNDHLIFFGKKLIPLEGEDPCLLGS